jgi:hypothetical protein
MSDAIQGWHDAQIAAEIDRLRAENARVRDYLDDVAQALHPHKDLRGGWTYVPDQLAQMVTELKAKLEAAHQAEAKAEKRAIGLEVALRILQGRVVCGQPEHRVLRYPLCGDCQALALIEQALQDSAKIREGK